MLDETELLQALRRHWEYAGSDQHITHEIYHDDAVLEFPQSGERFEGVENFREWRRQYPAKLKFHTRRITHRADLVAAENLISFRATSLAQALYPLRSSPSRFFTLGPARCLVALRLRRTSAPRQYGEVIMV